jgi:hypothetical protein
MAVRKRVWTTARGETREAWLVAYTDQNGTARQQQFDKKKDADAYHDKVRADVRKGIHVAPSESITVNEAADNWLGRIAADNRERSTLDQYRQHVRLHIVPALGQIRLAKLNTPTIENFRDKLLATMSRADKLEISPQSRELFSGRRQRHDKLRQAQQAKAGSWRRHPHPRRDQAANRRRHEREGARAPPDGGIDRTAGLRAKGPTVERCRSPRL